MAARSRHHDHRKDRGLLFSCGLLHCYSHCPLCHLGKTEWGRLSASVVRVIHGALAVLPSRVVRAKASELDTGPWLSHAFEGRFDVFCVS